MLTFVMGSKSGFCLFHRVRNRPFQASYVPPRCDARMARLVKIGEERAKAGNRRENSWLY